MTDIDRVFWFWNGLFLLYRNSILHYLLRSTNKRFQNCLLDNYFVSIKNLTWLTNRHSVFPFQSSHEFPETIDSKTRNLVHESSSLWSNQFQTLHYIILTIWITPLPGLLLEFLIWHETIYCINGSIRLITESLCWRVSKKKTSFVTSVKTTCQ